MLQAIIDKAVDSNTDIGELLRSCKVLASRLLLPYCQRIGESE